MAASGSAVAERVIGESSDIGYCGQYEWEWQHGFTRVTKNPQGTTGWGRVCRSSNPRHPTGTLLKFHLCAHNPCRARHPVSKYGMGGVPAHMQAITCMGPTASPLVPLIAAPPVREEDETAVAGATASGTSAVAAEAKVNAAVLKLAREIRRPRAYFGYIAFILFALCKGCRPRCMEGGCEIDLLSTYAPWALTEDTRDCAVVAISCGLVGRAGGIVECVPISVDPPLPRTSHYVAGVSVIPQPRGVDEPETFEGFYNKLGLAVLPSVCDGDCGADVMTMMLGIPQSFEARKQLRVEISDYLLARAGELWMLELLVAAQELEQKDVELCRSRLTPASPPPLPPPREAEAVVADTPAVAAAPAAPDADDAPAAVDDETMAALRWASKLHHDAGVLALARNLPPEIVAEQVVLYRRRDDAPAVADKHAPAKKIQLTQIRTHQQRMSVALRLHEYCSAHKIQVDKRMPYGAMRTFITDNIAWATTRPPAGKNIMRWYALWRSSPSNLEAAVAEADHHAIRTKPTQKETQSSTICTKSLLRSRAAECSSRRKRAHGGGRRFAAPMVRQALYEWWSSIRYAIDWKQLVADNRSRGLKKNLARFPRSTLVLKVHQLLQEHAHACLLNGHRVVSFRPDYWWFKRWEEEFGLSMRQANRKYEVPRAVRKQRMELFWVTLFRVRYFMLLVLGYDPVIYNFDQSPYHHNETGSQNKATLGVRGSVVPVVEGNSDVKARWTANLTTCSKFTAVAGGAMPWTECMFKAASDGPLNAKLQDYIRSRGFPSWFTVTTGPKGSYREQDIISFLKKHLEPWTEGRRWYILLADDFSAHKTENVFQLCWSRGYVLLIHGGGCTPVGQTPDTDLNEHVRRDYGNKEGAIIMEKMRHGQAVPRLTHEECLEIMLQVLSDPALHQRAAAGYKKVGESVDLHGREDSFICREAGALWNEETTDHHANMRQKVNKELAAVAEEVDSGGLTWCMHDVKRLICPYPPNRRVDRILTNLGEDFGYDDVHNAGYTEEAKDDSEDSDQELSEHYSEDDAMEDVEGVATAVAGDLVTSVGAVHQPEASRQSEEPPQLSVEQADQVVAVRCSIAALQGTIEPLRQQGLLRGVQALEAELQKQRRRERELVRENPAVAETFIRWRKAEALEFQEKQRIALQLKQRRQETAIAIAARDAAVADLNRTKRKLQELESARACKHAVKTFSLDALGAGLDASGAPSSRLDAQARATARKNRHEVLDRLSRLNAGLSDAQKNDFTWWKESWDAAMATEHGADWAATFAGWVQNILDSTDGNAFSKFMYDETVRVLHASKALAVPGG